MGALQSKSPAAPTGAPGSVSVVSVQDNPNWQAVANHAFEKPANSEAIILFSRTAVPNPCDLVGKSIIQVASALKDKDRAAAFAVGQGPCPSCTSPTLFFWNGKEWQNNVLADVPAVLRAVDGYVIPQRLGNVYHLYGDKDLKITSVARIAKVNDGEVVIGAGCNKTQGKNLQEVMNTSNVWFWIILIILIILILWLIFRNRRTTAVVV